MYVCMQVRHPKLEQDVMNVKMAPSSSVRLLALCNEAGLKEETPTCP